MRRNAGIIASLFMVAACSASDHEEYAAQTAVSQSGEALTIKASRLSDLKPVSAILTNRDTSSARARISGTLEELVVREGDIVEEGQVIAVISDDRRNLEASAGASAATATEVRAIQARADLKRVQELFDQGVYAQARLDAARAEARAAEAQLKSARAGSAALAEAASQGKVLAPAAGKVTRAPIPRGAVVLPGEIIAEIATGRRVLRAELPEADGSSLREGDAVRIAMVGDNEEVDSRIVQVYPAVQDGRIAIDIDAADLNGGFVGMRVPVLIPVGERIVIAAPERFVTVRYGVDYVRLKRGEEFMDVPIQRGGVIVISGEKLVEILSGLREGDLIVTPVAGDSIEDGNRAREDA